MQIGLGHSTTVSLEHESAKIDALEPSISQWEAIQISQKCNFMTKF
jgi:hypothetical protein